MKSSGAGEGKKAKCYQDILYFIKYLEGLHTASECNLLTSLQKFWTRKVVHPRQKLISPFFSFKTKIKR